MNPINHSQQISSIIMTNITQQLSYSITLNYKTPSLNIHYSIHLHSLSVEYDDFITQLQIFEYRQRMINSPFQHDDQNLQMISLQSTKNSLPSLSNHRPTFVPINDHFTQPSTPKIDVSQSSMFDIINNKSDAQGTMPSELNEDNDPPLLEDIGLDIDLIKKRMIAVLTFQNASEELITAPDLSGPILISLLLGFLLLLGGKMHFSDIETAFLVGNLLLYLLFNFMTKTPEIVPLYNIMSYLGYSLLPMLILAFLGIFTILNGAFGVVCSILLSIWSSLSCSGLISIVLNLPNSRIILGYPLFLFYVSFALIIIF